MYVVGVKRGRLANFVFKCDETYVDIFILFKS